MRHYASLLHATLAASLIVVVITAAALAGPREDIKEAHTAYRRGDDATAFRIVRQLAKQGVAAGQALFGAMYAEGAGAGWTIFSQSPPHKDRQAGIVSCLIINHSAPVQV